MSTETAKRPWWKTGMAAALLGAAIPAATFVQGWLQNKRELELQEGQQLQQLRLAYMNLMVEGGIERVEMLADFIADTEQNAGIRVWAEKQREKAQQAMRQLEARIADEQKKAAVAERERQEAETRAEKAEAEARRLSERANGDREEKERARETAERAKAAAASANRNARVTQAKVARSQETLHGRGEFTADGPAEQRAPVRPGALLEMSRRMREGAAALD